MRLSVLLYRKENDYSFGLRNWYTESNGILKVRKPLSLHLGRVAPHRPSGAVVVVVLTQQHGVYCPIASVNRLK